MVLKPGMEDEAEAIFRKWGLDFAVIGRTTDTLRFVVKHRGEVMADLPIKELGDEAPVYDRPHLANTSEPAIAPRQRRRARLERRGAAAGSSARPTSRSKRWVWEQYDHLILGNTVQTPGGDAAIVRIEDGPEGPRAHHRRDAALLRGRPLRGRQAGGGRGLAQHHGRRRAAARHHRQPQFRQSGAAGGDGPARRLHPRHRRGLPGARLPGRLRQRLALQRDQRPGHPADPDDRRRRRSWTT